MAQITKIKLTVKKQIEHLEHKGIVFNLTKKQAAFNFLSESSYFFKLKSYSKNYEKKVNGTYINLDFAYLQELSTLDMHFRGFCLRLTLDFEHMLKTKIMRDFNQNDDCDGYSIVNDFLFKNIKLKNHLNTFNLKEYTAKKYILDKYGLNLAIWNLIEIIDFGWFIKFCDFYYNKYRDDLYDEIEKLLHSVKCLRNSCAHNNCLLHNLRPLPYTEFRRNTEVTKLLKDNIKISKNHIEKKMQIPTMHDFIISLLAYKKITNSKKMEKAFNKDLHSLINIRLRKNKYYFKSNMLLTSNYVFLRKVLCFLKKY